MATANLNSRDSVKAIYPREAFEQDAALNGRVPAAVVAGVKILSRVDAAGAFELSRLSQHVGEADPEGDSIFLAPHRDEEGDALGPVAADQAAALAPAEALPDQGDRYEAFIDDILAAVSTAEFKPEIGRDGRLRGFRGG
jgi:hypothetical protein